jgi:hypothetical protein
LNTDEGLPPTWEDVEAAGLLEGLRWRYIAAGDACPVGRALDGAEFGSLAELEAVLPELGQPNPRCTHPPSCACTALPVRVGC